MSLLSCIYEHNWNTLARESIDTSFHEGCINSACFIRDGDFLATAGDDLKLGIWDSRRSSFRLRYSGDTRHRRNIFCIKELGERVATCSADGSVRVHALREGGIHESEISFHCGRGQVKRITTSAREPNIIISAGDDGAVKLFDVREGGACSGHCRHEIANFFQGEQLYSVTMAAERPELLAISGAQQFVWLLDRRRLPSVVPHVAQFMPEETDLSSHGVSSVALDRYANRLVGSWFHGDIHIFDTNQGIDEFAASVEILEQSSPVSVRSETLGVSTAPVGRFSGHLNTATVKDVQFVGPQESHVASGSDCGNFFVWDANSAELAFVGEQADSDVVNCVVSHPRDLVLVTCGIDNDFKVWAPTNQRKPQHPEDDEHVERIVERNREAETTDSQIETIERVFAQLQGRSECPLQ